MFGFDEIRGLSELLKSSNETPDDLLDQIDNNNGGMTLNPSHIGPKKSETGKAEVSKEKLADPYDIWNSDELNTCSDYTDIYDPRSEPQYTIHYKQTVDTSDVYLQLSNKTPSSASCEFMVIKIILPKTKYSDITLDVKESFLDLRTPIHKLGLHLPNPVDSDSGSAKWNSDKFELEVTLKNRRDLDFMNF